MKIKLYIFLLISVLFLSCELIAPDKEPPNISWQEWRVNSEEFYDINIHNDIAQIDSILFELVEFKVKVTDDYATGEVDQVGLYLGDTKLYSTTKTISSDIYLLKWNTTNTELEDSTYSLTVKATDSNENEQTSKELIVNIDQSLGFPPILNVLSIIKDENKDCIYWNNNNLANYIPDFSHFNIYQLVSDSLEIIQTIDDLSENNYCNLINNESEQFYNISAVDTFNFESIMLDNFSNLIDYNPIPINFVNIEYIGDNVIFEWEKSPDVDFDRYELWYNCDNCSFSNTHFYQTTNINETQTEINLFDDSETNYEDLYPNKSNEFWIKVYDQSENVSIGVFYNTSQNNLPTPVNLKSINYTVEGIEIEWYENANNFADFKGYNIYHSTTEMSDKILVYSILDSSVNSVFIDSSFTSEVSDFTFSSHFNPFNENWFWIGVEDKFGNISIGSGMSNLIDSPPPAVPISNWTKRKGNLPEFEYQEDDTITVFWQSLENQISDFKSFTVYMSTVADSIEDTLGTIYDVSQNNLQFNYDWDSKVNCDQSGELYFWGETEDAWGQKTLSDYVKLTEESPVKPTISSIYYESNDDQYVLEWNQSDDEDFNSYTIYYKHNDHFSKNNIFNESCTVDSSYLHEFGGGFTCPDICRIEIEDKEQTQFIYNLNEEDWTMYFLVVTEDVWGAKSYSTQLDCDQEDEDCGGAEKATPFTQIVFQSNRYNESNIYSVELDFESPGFPDSLIKPLTAQIGESFNPKFEPWGARITFYGWYNGNYEIFSIGAGGNNTPINLTNHPGNDYNPQFCSNGSKIVFESWRTGNCEIFIMDRDGFNLNQLTFNNGSDNDLKVATHTIGMDKFVYVSTINGNQEIFIMNEDGTEKRNLTENAYPQYSPSISKDGDQIVYIGENNGVVDIYWEDLVTGDSLNLTSNNFDERNPQFVKDGFNPNSESGDFIVYESNKDGTWSIYFQKIPSSNGNLNSPIESFAKSNTDQANPSFAEIILNSSNPDDISEGYMVYEAIDGNGSSTIFIVNEQGDYPVMNPNEIFPSGKLSNEFGEDFLPQIQP